MYVSISAASLGPAPFFSASLPRSQSERLNPPCFPSSSSPSDTSCWKGCTQWTPSSTLLGLANHWCSPAIQQPPHLPPLSHWWDRPIWDPDYWGVRLQLESSSRCKEEEEGGDEVSHKGFGDEGWWVHTAGEAIPKTRTEWRSMAMHLFQKTSSQCCDKQQHAIMANLWRFVRKQLLVVVCGWISYQY